MLFEDLSRHVLGYFKAIKLSQIFLEGFAMPRTENGKGVDLGDAQTILESITDAFYSLNKDWEFCYVNRQSEITLGRSAQELLGKNIWDTFPGTVGNEFERNYRLAAQERISVTFCSYYPDHDRWYEVNVYPAKGGLAIYFRNATARIQEERRREALLKLSDIFRNLSNPSEVTYEATQILGETLNVDRAGYGSIDSTTETLHVLNDWTAPGIESLIGAHRLRDYGSFIDDLHAGEFVSISDVHQDARTAHVAPALLARSAASFINFPVLEKKRLVALIYVNNGEAREWTPEEIAFIKEVGDRTRIVSERLRHERELAFLVSESERRRRLYETFLENSPDFAYVIDVNHRFTFANRELLTMWGRTWEETNGRTFAELGYETWHAEMHDRELSQVIETKRFIRGEVAFTGTNGRRIYDYIFVPVLGPSGEVEAIAGTTRDVTERREIEDASKEENRRKDDFLAMLAHELRNPLAPISSAATALQEFRLDENQIQNTSRIINRQVKHMTALVDDLLDVSRVSRGLVEIERIPVDLKTVVYEAVEQVRPAIEKNYHQLHFEFSPDTACVMGDQKRLVQIISNLLSNAAKYTPQGGAIHLNLWANNDILELSITDNGIGIESHFLPHIFDLFSQAERTSDRSQGGLGLGLSLAKNLTELHGGKIACVSAGENKGSTFTLSFPRHEITSQNENVSPELVVEDATTPLRVLVVDDNVDAADMLAMYLESTGHQTAVEYSPTSALERAPAFKPQVCILDIGLPLMDGYELVKRLRANPVMSSAFFIAVTGYGHESDKNQATEAGFDMHLVKPVNASQLVEILNKRLLEK